MSPLRRLMRGSRPAVLLPRSCKTKARRSSHLASSISFISHKIVAQSQVSEMLFPADFLFVWIFPFHAEKRFLILFSRSGWHIPRHPPSFAAVGPSACLKACSRLRYQRVCDCPSVPHVLRHTRTCSVQNGTCVIGSVRADAANFNRQAVIQFPRHRLPCDSDTAQAVSIITGNAPFVPVRREIVSVVLRDICICFPQRNRPNRQAHPISPSSAAISTKNESRTR